MVESLFLGLEAQNIFGTNKLLGWLQSIARWHMSNTSKKSTI
jgi:hypothetical protein